MSVRFSFEGKRALVTGAGKGIGRDIVKALHSTGAQVVALSRSQSDLDSLKAECPGLEVLAQDLRDWMETREAIGKLGYFDCLVNNAGVSRLAPFLEATKDDLTEVFETNVHSVVNVSQVVAGGMAQNGNGGTIVNISSQASKIGIRDHSAYCASKGALDALTKVMALELGPSKIRVNCVNPTVVMTKMGRQVWSDPVKSSGMLSRIPLGRFAEMEDVTKAVLFLLSDASAMTTGATVPVDGGLLCC